MKTQFNIMEGLEKVRKIDFIDIFLNKYPKVKRKDLAFELSAVNRDHKIVMYHNQGFIIDWGTLVHDKFSWGQFISSFNINYPSSFLTVGGDYDCEGGFGIHPNIHRKQVYWHYTRNNIIICLSEIQDEQIDNFTSYGYIHGAIQVVHNMFNNVERGDGLWYDFDIQKCDYCDAFVTEGNYRCDDCKNI